jgi:hypothetical protein
MFSAFVKKTYSEFIEKLLSEFYLLKWNSPFVTQDQ